MQPEDDMPIALLELASKSLDLTKTQRLQIEESYRGVAEAICENEVLKETSPHIQPQGSVLLGTVVKPSSAAEFDVDATCRLDLDHRKVTSQEVYSAVWQILKDHGVYQDKVEPKNRCIRVRYKEHNYHLDLTPCVPNPAVAEAVFVPDRALKCWKPSNPQLYAKLFEDVAAKKPSFAFEKHALVNSRQVALAAKIDPLPPEENFQKKLLKRIVQMLKRHRDIHFENSSNAVISIIITTLAARGYARIVDAKIYPSILDFVISVIEDMPRHIDVRETPSGIQYRIANPAIQDENFADKWNSDSSLPKAFEVWHKRILTELREFKRLSTEKSGSRELMAKTASIYGSLPAQTAAREFMSASASKHSAGQILITPSLGIGSSGVRAPGTKYYGK